MEYYVGIDLGTTNSAICTFDRETQQTRVWKSPERNDLTPSAIYINIKGDEHVGLRAYNQSPRSPDNCATLFKRFMGTNTPIELTAVNLTLTPEECSAKILKTLFGYLPEEIRNSPYTGTVITVPAVFNLTQKKATIAAAEMAGIGNVELVQEPVAAVMSYLNARGSTDGTYLIYDLSGGTLDIAIAESIGKRVAILAHGGIQMCGGRDFDRKIVDNIVRPWLHANFALPDNLTVNPWYKPLLRLATWATERARIELVAKDDTLISLSEVEIGRNDLKGDEIYLDIPLHRNTYDELIADHINNTIDAAKETLSKTGYTSNDIECIVWAGEATHYKPLRDKVTFELGINGNTLDVNPMTALAEGASIFAESICWEDENGPRLRSKEIDFVLRRNRLFKSNSRMDLLHNPFYILKVTQLDNRQRIMEASEERSLSLDVDTCIEAKSMLTIPTKRISAEVAWLPGIPPERANDILVLLESTTGSNLGNDNLPHDSLAAALSSILYTATSTLADQVLELLNPLKEHRYDGHLIEIEYFSEIGKFLGFDKLNPLTRTNLLAARMLRLHDYASEVITEWIIAIAQAFDSLDPSEVCTILNTERQESGFPEINDISDVETAIEEIRQYYKQVIKFVLECTYSIQERSQSVTTVVDSTIGNDTLNIPILIEDAIDSYTGGAETYLEIENKKVEEYDKKIRIAVEDTEKEKNFAILVSDLNHIVKDWGIIAQPIIRKKQRQGLRYEASHNISERVRLLAIFLYNEYDKLEFSQQIFTTLKEVFAEIPEIDERVTADLETLNKIAKQRKKNNQMSLFDNQ